MKLYTEKQVRKSLNDCGEYFIVNMVLEKMKPIELPSDDEIEKLQEDNDNYDDYDFYDTRFKQGVKWMKEQILNQNQ